MSEMSTEPVVQRDPLAELEKFRSEMEEFKGRIRSLTEKNANLERENEGLKQGARPAGPVYPSSEEAWFYALQQAELRVQANPDLAPQLDHLKYVYQQWRGQAAAKEADRQRDSGRLEAALAQMGIEPDSPQYKIALRALAGGASYSEVEATYLKSLRDLSVQGAEKHAKGAQQRSAKQGAIETGEGGSRPEGDDTQAGPTPDSQFMASLTTAMRGRAPASQRLAVKAG